jgi:hypothetical protein
LGKEKCSLNTSSALVLAADDKNPQCRILVKPAGRICSEKRFRKSDPFREVIISLLIISPGKNNFFVINLKDPVV